MSERLQGRIIEIDIERGYIGIRSDGGNLHRAFRAECGRLFGQLSPGVKVGFESHGFRAVRVFPVKPILPAKGAPLQGFVLRTERGFAILRGDDQRNYFAHIRQVGARLFGELAVGRGVVFSASHGERGLEATNIRCLNC